MPYLWSWLGDVPRSLSMRADWLVLRLRVPPYAVPLSLSSRIIQAPLPYWIVNAGWCDYKKKIKKNSTLYKLVFTLYKGWTDLQIGAKTCESHTFTRDFYESWVGWQQVQVGWQQVQVEKVMKYESIKTTKDSIFRSPFWNICRAIGVYFIIVLKTKELVYSIENYNSLNHNIIHFCPSIIKYIS